MSVGSTGSHSGTIDIEPASPVPIVEEGNSTALRKNAIGVLGILFFVLSAQAPLTGIGGALPLTIFTGDGAGAPGAYLAIGIIIILFAVGFIAMSRRIDAKGAFYAYIGAAFGRRIGTGSAWLAVTSYATVQAAMYGLLGATVSGLFAQGHMDVPWWVAVAVAIALVHVLGSLNIEFGAKILAVLVGCEVSILLLFAIITLISGGGSHGSINVTSSFSPSAVLSGSPGVALMFAIASMFGFESTAIYSAEAKDPKRTVARATYLSVSVIAIFFAFVSWMFVSYYGHEQVGAAAKSAVMSGNSTSLVFNAMSGMLGGWAGHVAQYLLVSSLFAGILAFHNGINRYLHALGSQGSLHSGLARTNRHQAPHVAACVQTILAIALVAPFAILKKDPVLTLFSWLSGLSVAALVVLYVLCSAAVVTYFLRNGIKGTVWQALVAPIIGGLCLLGVEVIIISNFPSLIGGSRTTSNLLLLPVPIVFALGVGIEWLRSRRNGPVAVAATTD